MALQKGDQSQSVTLFGTDKEQHTIGGSSEKNTVLLFFPMAFTGVCTKQVCFAQEHLAAYNNLDANVYGVSTDSVPVLMKFQGEQNLDYPLLSDFNKEAIGAFQSAHEQFPAFGMKMVAQRSVIILDKSGTVQHAEYCDSPGDMPNMEAISQTLEALNN